MRGLPILALATALWGLPAPAVAEPSAILTLEVSEPGWRVDLDGRVLGPSPLTARLPVAPGEHSVRFRRDAARVEQPLRIEAGQAIRVELPPTDRRRTARDVIGWGVVTLGTLGLATSAAFTVSSVIEHDAAEDARGDSGPEAAARVDLHTALGDRRRTMGIVAFAVGAATLGGGLALLWSGDEGPVPLMTVSPTGVSMQGRF